MIPISYLFELKRWKPHQIALNRQFSRRMKESPKFKTPARNALSNSMIKQAKFTDPKQKNALYRGSFNIRRKKV